MKAATRWWKNGVTEVFPPSKQQDPGTISFCAGQSLEEFIAGARASSRKKFTAPLSRTQARRTAPARAGGAISLPQHAALRLIRAENRIDAENEEKSRGKILSPKRFANKAVKKPTIKAERMRPESEVSGSEEPSQAVC
jgi:hypothetical protein